MEKCHLKIYHNLMGASMNFQLIVVHGIIHAAPVLVCSENSKVLHSVLSNPTSNYTIQQAIQTLS